MLCPQPFDCSVDVEPSAGVTLTPLSRTRLPTTAFAWCSTLLAACPSRALIADAAAWMRPPLPYQLGQKDAQLQEKSAEVGALEAQVRALVARTHGLLACFGGLGACISYS